MIDTNQKDSGSVQYSWLRRSWTIRMPSGNLSAIITRLIHRMRMIMVTCGKLIMVSMGIGARELSLFTNNMDWMWCGTDTFILLKGPGGF